MAKAELSEWLKLMLAEIARKQDEQRRAHEEQARSAQERASAGAGAP